MAKQFEIYTLSGRITDQNNQPIEDLLIYAFDQDPNTPDNPLGQPTITDAEGKYSISFTEEDFRIGGKESGGPDVFIRAYVGEALLGQSPVRRNAGKKISIDLQVNYEIRTENYIVTGGVYTSKRVGAPGTMVQVVDKRVEGDKFLGTLETDRSGQFRLEFAFPLLSKDKPDLQIVVIGTKDPNKVFGRSEVRYYANPEEKIDLILPIAAPNAAENLPINHHNF